MITAIVVAWPLMVVLGAIGHEFDMPQLFISYWLVFLVCFAIRLIAGLFHFSND